MKVKERVPQSGCTNNKPSVTFIYELGAKSNQMSRSHWPPGHTENRRNLIIRRKAIRKLWTLQYKVKCKVAGLLVISSFSSFSCWVELLSPHVRHLKIRTFPSVHVTRCLERVTCGCASDKTRIRMSVSVSAKCLSAGTDDTRVSNGSH